MISFSFEVISFSCIMAATHDRRAIALVDYSALEAGLSPGLKEAEKSAKSVKIKSSSFFFASNAVISS